MTSILGTWMNLHPEDFLQPPEYRSPKLVLAYARLNMPGTRVDRRAQFLELCMFHEPDEPEAPSEEQDPGAPQELTTAPALVPDAAAETQPPEAMSPPGAQPSEEAATLPAVPTPGLKVVAALTDPQEPDAARAPLGTPEQPQPAAPAGGVCEGAEQHPAGAERPPQLPSSGSRWLQPRRLMALTMTAVFVVCVSFINMFNGFWVFFRK
ncbi:uncharacterized protein KIAA0754-like isoform X2 [Suricata suricatta]|uniref:uncharacterized protein KIAA0754-like isoform X2 n=1 Tax=Suricata suricatta TaxID=37032 RepID=UPI001155CD35|nr:uncharacterized protein KIAA0754-like isoform X2 [Suricata suricatta]